MELAAINSPSAAFFAGLVTSLHCAGMCGPLACSLMPTGSNSARCTQDPQTISTVYHVCRLLSYSSIGALAGGIGRAPLTWISQPALRWLPWATVLLFVALAFRWDRRLPKPAFAARWLLRWRGQSRLGGAAMLGLATPLLPCGPLYFLLTLALLSGSSLRGVEFMLAFGLGTVPLLWFAQSRWSWLSRKLTPHHLARVRTSLALAAALVVAWRLRGTLGLPGIDLMSFGCF